MTCENRQLLVVFAKKREETHQPSSRMYTADPTSHTTTNNDTDTNTCGSTISSVPKRASSKRACRTCDLNSLDRSFRISTIASSYWFPSTLSSALSSPSSRCSFLAPSSSSPERTHSSHPRPLHAEFANVLVIRELWCRSRRRMTFSCVLYLFPHQRANPNASGGTYWFSIASRAVARTKATTMANEMMPMVL